MKKLFLLLAAGSLGACQTLEPVVQIGEGIAVKGDEITLDAARYFIVAQNGYQAAANIAAEAIRACNALKHNELCLTAGQRMALSSLNDNALKLIEGTDKTLSLATRTSSLLLMTKQIYDIIGRK